MAEISRRKIEMDCCKSVTPSAKTTGFAGNSDKNCGVTDDRSDGELFRCGGGSNGSEGGSNGCESEFARKSGGDSFRGADD